MILPRRTERARIRGTNLLLDLKEKRVLFTVAEHQNHPVAETDASRADNFECDIGGREIVKEVPALRAEGAAVQRKSRENGAPLGVRCAPENGRKVDKNVVGHALPET